MSCHVFPGFVPPPRTAERIAPAAWLAVRPPPRGSSRECKQASLVLGHPGIADLGLCCQRSGHPANLAGKQFACPPTVPEVPFVLFVQKHTSACPTNTNSCHQCIRLQRTWLPSSRIQR